MYAVAAFFSAPEAFFTCAPFLLLLYPELRQAKRQQQMREEDEGGKGAAQQSERCKRGP